MNYLRQSTAVDVGIGPFIDDDGITPATGLTITQAETRLKKNNAAWAQCSDATSATHEEEGWYEKELDATDTDTCGILIVAVYIAGNLAYWQRYQVVEEAVYDAFFAASALGYVANAPVNVAQISGDGTAADNLETAFDDTAGPVPWTGIIDQGTAQSVTATTIVLRAAAAFANDEIVGATIVITGGSTGVGQSRVITDYVLSTDTATVDAWTTTPSGTITYKIFPTAPNSTSTPIPVNVTQIAGAAVDTGTAQIGVNVVALDANAITATSIASDAITAAKIAAGAIDAATFAADVDAEILSYIVDDATRIDASDLNSKVDSLTFTVAGQVDANAVSMNDVTIIGAGTSGNLWRA